MKAAVVIQARMGSKRLPGKTMMDIGGRPLLWHVHRRAAAAGLPVILAVPEGEADLIRPCIRAHEDVAIKEGPALNVLGRYARIATEMGLDAICRVTGDCPLLDPKPISDVLYLFQTLLYDYVTNDHPRTYPCGLGVEIFSRTALESADSEATKPADREHVSYFMQRDKRNSIRNIRCPINGLSDLKLSVDTQDDLEFVRAIDAAGPRDFSLAATLEAIERVQDQD